jgi:hypothetical protein
VTIALSLPGAVILGIESLRGLRKGPSAGAPHPTTQTRS